MALRSSAYLDALQEIYAERQRLQDDLRSFVDQANYEEKISQLSMTTTTNISSSTGAAGAAGAAGADGGGGIISGGGGSLGSYELPPPVPVPVSISQWCGRLQHRAAVVSLVARVKANFNEEHELGTSFKYWCGLY